MPALGYLDYLKAAFRWRARIPGLGRMPINAMGLAAFAVLGLANPGFWFLGAAAEVTYLLWLSSSERFQNLVDGERLAADKESYISRVDRAVNRLSQGSQKRYHQLLFECRKIVGISDHLDPDAPESMRALRGSGLNQLLWIFLRLLNSREVLNDNLASVNREKIETEVAKLEQRLAAAGDDTALVRSLEGTLDIRKKRLENLDAAERSRKVIDAELERIEQQVVLIREESAVKGKADILSERLESVTSALNETNSWMEQNAEIFGRLGADPVGSAPSDLPELPQMESER